MSQAEAYRYRPLAQALRQRRETLRPRWGAAAASEAREAARLRGAQTQYIRDNIGSMMQRAWSRSSWRDGWTGLPAAVLGSLPAWYLSRPGGKKSAAKKRSRSVDRYEGFDPNVSYGTYTGVVWRPGGAATWGRPPKRWSEPDQPWPTAASGGDSGRVSRGSKTHFNSKVSYVRE